MSDLIVNLVVPATTVEQARRRVSAAKAQLTRAENTLAETRGCSILVHPEPSPSCARCVAYDIAHAAVRRAARRVENAHARLACVESQCREPAYIGGER